VITHDKLIKKSEVPFCVDDSLSASAIRSALPVPADSDTSFVADFISQRNPGLRRRSDIDRQEL
jgi:hypothetical protein